MSWDLKIKIPRRLVAAWDRFCDWGNEPIAGGRQFGGRGILRLDIINAFGFALTCVYFYWVGGWWMMAAGILSYIMVAMCAVWFGPNR